MNKHTRYPFRGESLPLREIVDRTGIGKTTLLYRYRKLGCMERAASEPVRTRQECGRVRRKEWRA